MAKLTIEGDQKKIDIIKKRFRTLGVEFKEDPEKEPEVEEEKPKRGRKKND